MHADPLCKSHTNRNRCTISMIPPPSYQLSGENPRNHHRSVRQPNKVRLVTARVEPLLDPFCVAFREPTFFDEAIHRFPQQVHVSSPTSIHLEDSSGVERHLVAHFT